MEQPSPAANTGTLYSLAFSRITILEARPRANLGQPTLAANTGIFFLAGLISKTTILETHLLSRLAGTDIVDVVNFLNSRD